MTIIRKSFATGLFATIILLIISANSRAQAASEGLIIRSQRAGGSVYMLDAKNGFAGGNVAASVGKDGVLIVDNLFRTNTHLLLSEIEKMSMQPVRLVINTHFHRDHVEGNAVLSSSAIVIGHENLFYRLRNKSNWASDSSLPHLLVKDSLMMEFNGERIQLLHLPNGHSDNDVVVYFTRSGVIHMGDLFFHGMFPAVYKESGGDIRQMVRNLEQISAMIPDQVKVIPGHGELATKKDLQKYILMLKETIAIVENALHHGKSLEEVKKQRPFSCYDDLGRGGAQTTDQYLAMLFKLLSPT